MGIGKSKTKVRKRAGGTTAVVLCVLMSFVPISLLASSPANESEKIIRGSIGWNLHKDPNALTDDDYKKVLELDIRDSLPVHIDHYPSYYQTLHLYCSKVSDFNSLEKLTNLQDLDISCKEISDINFLAKLTSLQQLRISGTKVTDINSLANLTNLQILALFDATKNKLLPLI